MLITEKSLYNATLHNLKTRCMSYQSFSLQVTLYAGHVVTLTPTVSYLTKKWWQTVNINLLFAHGKWYCMYYLSETGNAKSFVHGSTLGFLESESLLHGQLSYWSVKVTQGSANTSVSIGSIQDHSSSWLPVYYDIKSFHYFFFL